MALGVTLTTDRTQRIGVLGMLRVLLAFDNSYPTGGYPMATVTALFDAVLGMLVDSVTGYEFGWNLSTSKLQVFYGTNSAAAHTHTVTSPTAAGSAHTHAFTGTAISAETATLFHNANAAVDGVAVYLHTKDGVTGWLEFVSPTNADGVWRLASSGSYALVFDSDAAATDGFQVYVDDSEAEGVIKAINPLPTNVLVPVSGGQALTVVYTAGVAGLKTLYFDEDLAANYNRMQANQAGSVNHDAFCSSTWYGLPGVPAGANANEATHTHGVTSPTGSGGAVAAGAATEVANGTNLSALTGISCFVLGTM